MKSRPSKILAVDDVADNLFMMQTILSEEGYCVSTSSNGLDAIASVEASPPDLILLDVMMPKMNGYEVTYNCTLEDNLIESNLVGFAGYTGDETNAQDCHHFHLHRNTFHDNRVGAMFKRTTDCTVESNIFKRNIEAALRLVGKPGVKVDTNTFESNRRDVAEE